MGEAKESCNRWKDKGVVFKVKKQYFTLGNEPKKFYVDEEVSRICVEESETKQILGITIADESDLNPKFWQLRDKWKPIYNRSNIPEEFKYRKYFKY